MSTLPAQPSKEPTWLQKFEIKSSKKRRFLRAYLKCGSFAKACVRSGTTPGDLKRWREGLSKKNNATDPAEQNKFNEALAFINELRIDELEGEARRRAKEKSDLLMIFLLKGARPQKYRDNSKFDPNAGQPGKSAGTVVNNFFPTADSEHLKRVIEVAKQTGLISVIQKKEEKIVDAEFKVDGKSGQGQTGSGTSAPANNPKVE